MYHPLSILKKSYFGRKKFPIRMDFFVLDRIISFRTSRIFGFPIPAPLAIRREFRYNGSREEADAHG